MTTPAQVDQNVIQEGLSKLLKPGSKTTEFFGLIAVYAGALVTLLGAFNTHSAQFNAILKIAALVAAAASHVGYALSRGDVKAAVGAVVSSLAVAGVIVPSTGKHAAPNGDAGAVDLIGLVAGVLAIAGLIWLVVGFTHHRLDVFGLVLLLVGLGIYFLFGGWGSRYLRRRP